MDYEVAPHCYHSAATIFWVCYRVPIGGNLGPDGPPGGTPGRPGCQTTGGGYCGIKTTGDIGGPRPGDMLGPLNLVVIIIIVTYDMHLIQGTEYKFDDSKSPSVPEACVRSMKDMGKSLQDAKLKTKEKQC
ncbi:hypothetical protein Tco_0266854 [Tanacetum coccineum]